MSRVQFLQESKYSDCNSLSKSEHHLLDLSLFIQVVNALCDMRIEAHMNYFKLLRLKLKKEIYMIEDQIIKFLINDIIESEEYTLSGIAYYTNTPEDVVYEIATGKNTNPSLKLSRKILELHRSIRKDFYARLMSKICSPNDPPLDSPAK